MAFWKSPDEVARVWPETIDFFDAEMLIVAWETTPEAIARLLPPPLAPGGKPYALAFVADYPRTNFGVSYREAALFLPAVYAGEEGGYCLAMPVTDDVALVLGREVFGFPKKIATIAWTRKDQRVGGWAERHGTRFFEVQAGLGGQFNLPEAQEAIAAAIAFQDGVGIATVYNFKCFPAPEAQHLSGFDYAPRLVRQRTELRPSAIGIGQAEVTLRSSAHDPWGDVPVVRVLGAMYAKGNNRMLPGEVVAESSAEVFKPYALIKYDF